MAFLWALAIVGAIIGATTFIGTAMTADSAPKEAAGAAMALGFAVIPYCFARACSEISGNSGGAAVRELKSLNEKLALISPKPVLPKPKGD